MQQTDLRVQEVALSVGYPAPLAFSAAFKSFFGVSPTDHRRDERQNGLAAEKNRVL